MSRISYPYPILMDDQDNPDYISSKFECDFNGTKIVQSEDSQILNIKHKFSLDNKEILKLLEDEVAQLAIEVSCRETRFREIKLVENVIEKQGELKLPLANFLGKVEIDPYIIVIQKYPDFYSEDFNEEFGLAKFSLRTGDTLAIAEGIVRYIEYEQQEFESLVRTMPTADLEPLSYEINLDGPMITIYLGLELNRVWQEALTKAELKPYLYGSIVKDCVFFALIKLKDDGNETEFAWARSLSRKLNSIGEMVNPDSELMEVNRIAQKIISGLSFGKIFKTMFRGGI